MIEETTRDLYLAQQETRNQKAFLESVLASLFSTVLVVDGDDRIIEVGGTAEQLSGRSREVLTTMRWRDVLTVGREGDLEPRHQIEGELLPADGPPIPVLINVSALADDDQRQIGLVLLVTDLRERRELEMELRQAHRLESIGQLAAGVAHEINTPIQFVGDSAQFLGEVFTDVMGLVDRYEPLRAVVGDGDDARPLVDAITGCEEDIDLPFIRDEGPKAVARTLDGIDRIASIVRALKEFSHPGGDEMAPVRINDLIDNTLNVARSEYKYVAEVRTDLADVPEVVCHRGDIGQVFINLVVNAAQAIAAHHRADGAPGSIRITTRPDGEGVLVEIADNGGGIPVDIRHRVFEPFFTTKDVGHGTGQGLAIAHNVVVAKHHGRLTFDVDDGLGTTFRVWLPLEPPS